MLTDKQLQAEGLIRITSLMDLLRDQLFVRHETKEPGYQPLFRIRDATVEADVIATTEVVGQTGISLYVAQFGAKGAQVSGTTFRIAITLEPLETDELKDVTYVGPKTTQRTKHRQEK